MNSTQENFPQPAIDPEKGGLIRDSIMKSVLKNPAGITKEEVFEEVKVDLPQVTDMEIEEVISYMLRNGSIEQNVSLLKKRRVPIPGQPLF